ncbi:MULTISPECIES: hypothetical protein [unclassified Hwanghaeella]|jgi:methionyl-tRNA formyltransferase|uniref:hypothetical protein n=1 Tax=unclassified Hwanghaeella TaxID=2605944 RepID=UPI000C93B27A|nr:hypothetical protein [Rhodospirillales bacterium]|tara:strand:+ start:103532 stop:104260 length:729 start_codon:yes stop_codon:yes gene_type:complete
MMEPKNLRVGILTTDTPHHTHFVEALSKNWNIVRVFEEKRTTSATFETNHQLEEQGAQYEIECWFEGKSRGLSDVADVQTFADLNDPDALDAMRDAHCDVHLAFGTGRLEQSVIDITPDRIVNLHGADPEHYRGLDTQLWAVYHRDYRGLITTLHKVSPNLDRGGVIMKMPLPLTRDMQLYQLRKVNTEVCLDISHRGLDMMATYGQFISQPQLYIGRHYSFMPAVLKDRCIKQFAEFTATL